MLRTQARDFGRWGAFVIALWVGMAMCTDCYYPNGNLSPNNNDQPCSTADGAACCPLNWQCLDNGLCYYPSDNYYGRYGCTDKTWGSPLCPRNLCTNNLKHAGDEAILQCSNQDDQWCCNGDRVHVHCCTDSNIEYFEMPEGKAYATVGGSSTPASGPTVNSFGNGNNQGGNGASSTTAASSSAAASSSEVSSSSAKASAADASTTSDSSTSSTSKSTTPITTIQTSLSSGSNGVATVFITAIVTPSSSPTSSAAATTSSKKSSNTGLIVGCAVGVPAGLAIIGAVALLLYRRRNQNPKPVSPDPGPPAFAGGKFASGAEPYGPAPTELGGNPIGTGLPISVVKGHAELATPVDVQGAPMHRPTESWGSTPPGYSPGMAPGGVAEMGSGAEGQWVGQAQANQTAGGRYIPYRPEAMEQLPERVELPARDLRTPP